MTKTKRQLRAEAVERLRQLAPMDTQATRYVSAMLGSIAGMTAQDVTAELIELLTDDGNEMRDDYEERLYDVPVSDCPYCGCERVVIRKYSEAYERPHSYRVEHVDEKEAFDAGCFEIESYFGFDSAEKAVRHADMRDESTNGTDSETNGIHDEPPEGDALRELRNYADDVRYYYDPLDDAFLPDDRLAELCEHAADMVERDYVRNEAYKYAHREFNRMNEERREMREERDKLKAERDEALDIRDKALGDAATFKAERDELQRKLDIADRHEAESDQACDECKAHSDELLSELTAELNDALKAICKRFDVSTEWSAEDAAKKVLEAVERDYVRREDHEVIVESEVKARDACARHAANMEDERDEWQRTAEDYQERKDELVTERDFLQGALDIAVQNESRLESERDKWKAKAEGFAEALEKLGCSVLENGTVFANGNSTCEPKQMVDKQADSREKLEADIWRGCTHLTIDGGKDMLVDVVYDVLIGWLDRQAAITEVECIDRWDAKALLRVDELTAERDEWRERCGRMLDAAHEITRIGESA